MDPQKKFIFLPISMTWPQRHLMLPFRYRSWFIVEGFNVTVDVWFWLLFAWWQSYRQSCHILFFIWIYLNLKSPIVRKLLPGMLIEKLWCVKDCWMENWLNNFLAWNGKASWNYDCWNIIHEFNKSYLGFFSCQSEIQDGHHS